MQRINTARLAIGGRSHRRAAAWVGWPPLRRVNIARLAIGVVATAGLAS